MQKVKGKRQMRSQIIEVTQKLLSEASLGTATPAYRIRRVFVTFIRQIVVHRIADPLECQHFCDGFRTVNIS